MEDDDQCQFGVAHATMQDASPLDSRQPPDSFLFPAPAACRAGDHCVV